MSIRFDKSGNSGFRRIVDDEYGLRWVPITVDEARRVGLLPPPTPPADAARTATTQGPA